MTQLCLYHYDIWTVFPVTSLNIYRCSNQCLTIFGRKHLELGNNFSPKNISKYVDMPGTYTFNIKREQERKKGFSIGWVHTVSPACVYIFYLWMLLHHDHCRRKTTYKDLLTIDRIGHVTFQSFCCEIDLLSDDQEWTLVLREAQIR